MREVSLKSLDLNLLIALNALLEEKQITRAAARIHLSQSAMSRAFSRLKKMFNDPLLVQSCTGLALTERAAKIYHPLQLILRDIHHLITPPTINPHDMKGEIVIAARDYELAIILPSVIRQITEKAPNLTLRIVPLIGDDLDALEYHKVDMVLTATESESASLHRHTLYQDDFVSLVAKKNKAVKNDIDFETYVSMKHCLISTATFTPSLIDQTLISMKRERKVVIRVPHFLAAAHVVENSELIVTLPRKLGEELVKRHALKMVEVPLKVPSFPIYLYWHVRNQTNGGHGWVRELIKHRERE